MNNEMMSYEVVDLQEKKVVGLSARTNNASPEMGNVIGSLWQKFYTENCYPAIKNKANEKSLGIYTDYEADEKGDYTVVVACEVTDAEDISQEWTVRTIPAGKYAKFVVRGNMMTAVAELWQELWKMDLPRSFICDFEEYQNADPENAEIHVYIGLK